MSDLSTFKFFTTQRHPCSYLEGKQATTLFLDPDVAPDDNLYSHLSRLGFRRSGNYLYRPHCADCTACLPVRIDTKNFQWKRRFRRILQKNNDLTMRWEKAAFHPDIYALYARYIDQRHSDGDMYPPSLEQFQQFLFSRWSDTRFLSFFAGEKRLAVAVTDQLDDGYSAVYSFFEPQEAHRSLGTFAILKQIEICQAQDIPYLYLGYLVRQCQKMAYKADFQPLQVFSTLGWQPLPAPPQE